MSTAKQIAANRRNGALSRGPKTQAGKNRSRNNALKHGLAAQMSADPLRGQEIETLARALGEPAGPDVARAIAEAQLELQRVARYRSQLLWGLQGADDGTLDPHDEIVGKEEMSKIVLRLQRLLRYERRAGAKRNRAIRPLVENKKRAIL